MLGEGVMLIPLETTQQTFSVDRLLVQLEFNENLLQLIRDTISGLDSFLIVAEF